MTEQEKILSTIKYYHRGRHNAITYKNLSLLLGVNERELRLMVADLVTKGHPIASSQEGYWYIDNQSEFELAHNELLSRIKMLSRRARGLRLGWTRERQLLKPKQLELADKVY